MENDELPSYPAIKLVIRYGKILAGAIAFFPIIACLIAVTAGYPWWLLLFRDSGGAHPTAAGP